MKPAKKVSRCNDKAHKRREVRKADALDLRLKGFSYRAIGEAMGIDQATAYRLVSDALAETREITQARADELREIEVQRLDHLLESLAPHIEAGDPNAVNSALRVSKRRSELLGLDTPVVVKQEVETTVKALQIVVPDQFKSAEEWESSQT